MPPNKGLAAQFHWPLGCEVTGLININGGHSNAYIRNAGPGSVPKIANATTVYLHFNYYHSGPSGQSFHISDSLHHSRRLVCFALLIAFQVWESILDHLFSRWLTVVVYVLKYNRGNYKAKPMVK